MSIPGAVPQADPCAPILMLFSGEPAAGDQRIQALAQRKLQLPERTPVIPVRQIQRSPGGESEEAARTLTPKSESSSEQTCGTWNRARCEEISLEEAPLSISKAQIQRSHRLIPGYSNWACTKTDLPSPYSSSVGMSIPHRLRGTQKTLSSASYVPTVIPVRHPENRR